MFNYKKIFFCCLFLFILLSVVGCSNDGNFEDKVLFSESTTTSGEKNKTKDYDDEYNSLLNSYFDGISRIMLPDDET